MDEESLDEHTSSMWSSRRYRWLRAERCKPRPLALSPCDLWRPSRGPLPKAGDSKQVSQLFSLGRRRLSFASRIWNVFKRTSREIAASSMVNFIMIMDQEPKIDVRRLNADI